MPRANNSGIQEAISLAQQLASEEGVVLRNAGNIYAEPGEYDSRTKKITIKLTQAEIEKITQWAATQRDIPKASEVFKDPRLDNPIIDIALYSLTNPLGIDKTHGIEGAIGKSASEKIFRAAFYRADNYDALDKLSLQYEEKCKALPKPSPLPPREAKSITANASRHVAAAARNDDSSDKALAKMLEEHLKRSTDKGDRTPKPPTNTPTKGRS